MFTHTEDLQSYIQEQPKTLSYTVTKWWKTLNYNFAYRLFHLAKTGDKSEKRKAIQSLTSLKFLKGIKYFFGKYFHT